MIIVDWDKDPQRCGQWIKCTRMKVGMTQPDLASAVGCSVKTIKQIENAETKSKFFKPAYRYLRDRYLENFEL